MMAFGRKGKVFESEVRHLLQTDFNPIFIVKAINTERIDFFLLKRNKVILVEAKECRKDKYYPLENERKRKQMFIYFKVKQALESEGFEAEVWLYIKKIKPEGSSVLKVKLDKYADIKTYY